MNTAKVREIIRREFVESVRKKSFVFGLVATPALLLLLISLPVLVKGIVGPESVELWIIDRTAKYGELLRDSLMEEPSTPGAPVFRVKVYGPDQAPPESVLAAAARDGDITAWIVLPEDFAASRALEYHSASITDPAAVEALNGRAQKVLTRSRAQELGLDREDVDTLLLPVQVKTFVTGRAGVEEADFTVVYLRAVALVMILFFALLPTGQILMRSVIEEKTNRVIEVLLSSVTPRELMVGKILGLGAVGLTLLAVWCACGVLLALRAGQFPISTDQLGIFLLYFLPGFFLYAAIFASVGSVCSSERETHPFQTPISLTLAIPVFLGFAILQEPNHVIWHVASFFPLITPSLMLFRFVIRQPPLWEIVATWITLVAATVGMMWTATRVFRVGILIYGKRPTIPEILRWVRSS